jgi:hypothetical protein
METLEGSLDEPVMVSRYRVSRSCLTSSGALELSALGVLGDNKNFNHPRTRDLDRIGRSHERSIRECKRQSRTADRSIRDRDEWSPGRSLVVKFVYWRYAQAAGKLAVKNPLPKLFSAPQLEIWALRATGVRS